MSHQSQPSATLVCSSDGGYGELSLIFRMKLRHGDVEGHFISPPPSIIHHVHSITEIFLFATSTSLPSVSAYTYNSMLPLSKWPLLIIALHPFHLLVEGKGTFYLARHTPLTVVGSPWHHINETDKLNQTSGPSMYHRVVP